MYRDPRLYLDDILEAIALIREYILSMDYESFVRDRKTQDAVARNLVIIGEAAGRLPENVKHAASMIEWRKIVGLRNILIHQYFGISLPLVWDVVHNKLGPLESACRKLLEDDSRSAVEQK
jgi:uncharacterized protein with HEPN domain